MFPVRVTVLLVLSAAALPLAAQGEDPAVVAAQTARGHWRDAGRANAAGDARGAARHASLAAHAFPTQSAYWIGLARAAGRAGDSSQVNEALRVLAGLQLGQPLLHDTAVTTLGSAALIASLRAATAELVGGRVAATIADTTVFAEGLDADETTGQLFVASVRQRTVFEIGRDGRVRDLGVSRNAGVGAVLGVRVAADGRHLWITTSGIPQALGFRAADSTIAALLLVGREDGRVVRHIDLPADPRGHVLGDLTIGPLGDVFVTDSKAPVLYRLRPGKDTVERITHSLFRSLQGAAATKDGTALFVADYSHGLLRITLATGAVTRVADAPSSTSLGLDGIVLHANAIIAVQNGVAPARVMRYELSPDGTRILKAQRLDQQSAADEPTTGTLLRGAFLYVANSQWEQFDDDGRRRAGTTLAPTLIIEVPLPLRPRRGVQVAAGTGR